jgi:hypothetical protein
MSRKPLIRGHQGKRLMRDRQWMDLIALQQLCELLPWIGLEFKMNRIWRSQMTLVELEIGKQTIQSPLLKSFNYTAMAWISDQIPQMIMNRDQ